MKKDTFDSKTMWNVSIAIAVLIALIVAIFNLQAVSDYFINALLK